MEKPRLSFRNIFNMSFGFFGIQVGFGLQGANMGRIYQTLGTSEEDLPLMFLAAPLTGLIVQPIIGYMSDRTWGRFGRRRPYFFVGAVLSSIALLIMPYSPTAWFVFGMLWILDASINISMEPFRAFVADKLPPSQRTFGYSMQSIVIGVGAVLASLFPYIFTALGIDNTAVEGQQTDAVKLSFAVGAVFFIGAVMYTVFTTREYPPEDLEAFEREKRETAGFGNAVKHIFGGILAMPKKMQRLAVVQFFTWFALFALFIFNTPAITAHVYGTTDPNSEVYNQAGNWIGVCFAVWNGMAAIMGFLLPSIANAISRKTTHMVCLVIGALGFFSIYFVPTPEAGQDSMALLGSFALMGIAWGSILSMPYAMLSTGVPAKKMGMYMGVFNFFICFPQILASVGLLNWLTDVGFGSAIEAGASRGLYAMMIGGILMLIAAASVFLVDDSEQAAAE